MVVTWLLDNGGKQTIDISKMWWWWWYTVVSGGGGGGGIARVVGVVVKVVGGSGDGVDCTYNRLV